jgi:hypothetical protein
MESASRPECGGNPKAIMALFILSIVGLLATAALIWCLTGFSRALKEKPKVIGLLLRVEINDAHMGQHKAMVIAFPGHLPQQTGTARVRKYRSVSLLIVVWIAILLASPAAKRNLLTMASPTPTWNSETQQAVFVELSETRVHGS